jgi:hypothetical protein
MGRWQGLVLGGGVLLVLAGAGLLFGTADGAGAQGTAVISISPASQQKLITDEPFNIEIRVDNVQNLGSWEVALKFDPNVLEYLGAASYGFLQATGRSEACPPIDPVDSTVAPFGCTTNGILDQGQGLPGPSGSGVLGVMAFKPKGTSIGSPLTLIGIDEPDHGDPVTTKVNQTGLAFVESCDGNNNCSPGLSIAFGATTATVQVNDPNAGPTPTALPPTPTPQPRAAATPNKQATVRAALGTPERTLGENTNGSSSGTPGAIIPAQSGPDGVLGTVDDIPARPAGSVAAASAGRNGIGAPDTGVIGPDGVPIAGYGPQAHNNPWPGRAGATMIMLGAMVVGSGLVLRRRVTGPAIRIEDEGSEDKRS